MAKKKRKLTKAEQDYNRNRRRIKDFIRRAEKRGFVFPEFTMPDRPNKITQKAVKELERWTPQKFYETGYYKTSWAGEVVPATTGRKMERQAAYRRGVEHRESPEYTAPAGPPRIEDKILKAVEELIDRFPDPEQTGYMTSWQLEIAERHYSQLKNLFETQIALNGRAITAMRLNAAGQEIVELAEKIMYGDSKDAEFQMDLNTFAIIIKGEALSLDESELMQELAAQYGV